MLNRLYINMSLYLKSNTINNMQKTADHVCTPGGQNQIMI